MTIVPAIVDLQYVEKSYGAARALGPVSFSLRKNEISVFLGPNGAGKSTTFKLILGLREPTRGRVSLFGDSPRKPETRMRVGYTSQDLSYPPNLKTKEVLSLVLAHFAHRQSIADLRERFLLSDIFENKVGGLSGGERRRLGLACALAGNPELLVLDEPTTGLDVEARGRLWDEIRAFRANGGSVLLATHDLHEAGLIGDRVLLFERGLLEVDGTVDDILRPIDFKKIRYRVGEKREEVSVRDSDAFVRELISRQVAFSDLEIRRLNLEEALALRSDGPRRDGPRSAPL